MLPVFALVFSIGLAAAPSTAQQAMETSDDLRRLPIPHVRRSQEPVLVLRGGTLLTGTAAPEIPNAMVVIQGDRIVAAGPATSTPVPTNAAWIVDTAGLTMLPGLIDLHIHFTQQRGSDLGMYSDSDAAMAIRGVVLAGQLIDAG